MNIFHKVALQGLKKNRTRTFVTILGVLLSAALFTGVATFAVSLQHYMIRGAEVKYGSWHVALPESDSDFVADAEQDSRVSEIVTLQNLGYAALKDGKNPDKPYLFLSGWDQKAFDTLPLKLISGRLPERSNEVLIPAHLAANGGVKISVGDTISLAVGDRMSDGQKLGQHDAYLPGTETLVPTGETAYTVVGICQRPAIEEFRAPGYTLITTAKTSAADDLSVFVTLKNPYRIRSYTQGIEGDYILNDDVLRFLGLSGEKVLTVLLYSIVAILVVLVVIGSVFLIYNAFHISLNERTHQFGILMSVGATERQLRNSVLFEGLCIGAIGIPLGILVGVPGAKLILLLVEKNFINLMYDGVSLDLVVSAPILLAAAGISLVTILLSAYLPAKKAASIPVMDCIRQTNAIKLEGKEQKTSRLVQRFLGLEEMLALKNFKRNKRRYRSIVLSLTFSVVLFVSANAFGTYLHQSAENSNEVVEQYDIVFSSRDMGEDELLSLYGQMKDVQDVTASGYQAQATYPCVLPADQLSDRFFDTFGPFLSYDGKSKTVDAMLDVVFVDDDSYRKQRKRLGLSEEDDAGADNKMIMAAFVEGYMYLQDEPMEITLCDEDGEAARTIHATCVNDYPDLLPPEAGETYRGYSLLLIVPYEAKASFDALGTAVQTTLGMTFESDNPGGSTARMRTLLDANSVASDYTLYNVYEILEQNRNIEFVINLFAAVFILMITLIAVANVFNTISTNIRLRRRELAMLRSVGMSDRDFNRMMCFECVLYGAQTMLWGLPLSVLLSVLIYRGMILGGAFALTYVFPWDSIAISVSGVFLIVLITMLYVTSKIRKENIIDALRDEIT
ncbi:MAG: ABC transporter permease [Eubacteriales bacterium]|nr:ABC transporter permease [Eubacteriales bacterium]